MACSDRHAAGEAAAGDRTPYAQDAPGAQPADSAARSEIPRSTGSMGVRLPNPDQGADRVGPGCALPATPARAAGNHLPPAVTAPEKTIFARLRTADAALAALQPQAPQLVCGVLEMLVADGQETVHYLPAEDITALGGPAALQRIGRDNLRTVLDAVHDEDVVTAAGARFTLLSGDSVYVASLALLLPEVIARLAPGTGGMPLGVLVIFPVRDLLAFHVIRDRNATVTLQEFAKIAATMYEEGTGPLSPHVHWWRGGPWDTVTTIAGEPVAGQLGPDLRSALEIADLTPGPGCRMTFNRP
jgi:hypothetical protein